MSISAENITWKVGKRSSSTMSRSTSSPVKPLDYLGRTVVESHHCYAFWQDYVDRMPAT